MSRDQVNIDEEVTIVVPPLGETEDQKKEREAAAAVTPAKDAAVDPKLKTKAKTGAEEGADAIKKQVDAANQRTADETSAREAAEKRARDATAEAMKSRGEAFAARYRQVADGIESTKSVEEAAKRDYAAAMEASDWTRAAEAQSKMSEGAARRIRLQERKGEMDGEIERAKTQTREQPDETRARTTDAYSEYTPRTASWLRAHPEYLSDPKKNARAMSAHHEAISEDIVVESEAYFDFLEKKLGLKVDDEDASAGDDTEVVVDPKTTRSRRAPAAPASREVPGARHQRGGKVTLTPAQREAARVSGISEEEYARQLLRIEDEKTSGVAA